jgi:hypothetical protein
MLKIMGLILAIYLVSLAVVDTATFGGRYRSMVWQEVQYRVYRANVEVRYMLDKAGSWAYTNGFAGPSRANDGR